MRGPAGLPTQPDASPDVGLLLERSRHSRPVTVVILAHGDRLLSETTIASVVDHTRDARIHVIDDAPGDPDSQLPLRGWEASGRLSVHHHPTEEGPASSIDEALSLGRDGDLVLVDAGVEVGPAWLAGLRRVARSQDAPTAVSPVADAGDGPGHLTSDEVTRFVGRSDLPWSVPVPVASSGCVLITADGVGALTRAAGTPGASRPDAGRGLAARLSGAGLALVAAPRVRVCRREQPDPWIEHRPPGDLAPAYAEIREHLEPLAVVLPRLLYTVNAGPSRARDGVLDLMFALADVQESFLLETHASGQVDLSRWGAKGLAPAGSWRLRRPFAVTDGWRQDYGELVASILIGQGIDGVHVAHLVDGPLTTVPSTARRLGVPYLVAAPDFHLVCPSSHLLDDRRRFCSGVCTPGDGPCDAPSRFALGTPRLKHEWVHEWQRRAATVLDGAAAVVAPTEAAAGVLGGTFPSSSGGIVTLPAGTDLGTRALGGRPDGRRPGRLRALVWADWETGADAAHLHQVMSRVTDSIEWHVTGRGGACFADVAVDHGPLERSRLPRLAGDLDPDLAVLLPLWPDPDATRLTLAWAMGIPVVASATGAAADEIRRHGGGTLVPVGDVHASVETLRRLSSEPHLLAGLRAGVPGHLPRTRLGMAQEVRSLYARRLIGDRDVPGVGYVVHGGFGVHPGSGHIRLIRLLRDAELRGLIATRQTTAAEVASHHAAEGLAAVVVQRDALDGDAEAFCDHLAAAGCRLVVELDDNLLHDSIGTLIAGRRHADDVYSDRLRTLLTRADTVLASTPILADLLRAEGAAHVTVVPNRLDPRLWATRVEPVERAGGLRVLYMGSATHADDLALLRGVPEELSERLHRRVDLEIVGVAPPGEAGWVSRLDIPAPARNYPQFVAWLRAHRLRWAAAVAPLVDSDFNATKSDLKLLEYAALGLPTVASGVGPYRGEDPFAVRVDDTREAWVGALEGLLADPPAADRQVAGAARWLEQSGRWLTAENVAGWAGVVTGRDLR